MPKVSKYEREVVAHIERVKSNVSDMEAQRVSLDDAIEAENNKLQMLLNIHNSASKGNGHEKKD